MPRPTKRNFKTKKRNVSIRKNVKKSMKGGLDVSVKKLINKFEGKQQKKTPPPVTSRKKIPPPVKPRKKKKSLPVTSRKQKQINNITPEPIYNNPEYGIPPNDKSRSGNTYNNMVPEPHNSEIGTYFPNIESIYNIIKPINNTNESSNEELIYNTIEPNYNTIEPINNTIIQPIQPEVYKQQQIPLQNESIYETVNQNNLKKKEKRKKIYEKHGKFNKKTYIINPPRKLTKKLGKWDYKNRVRKLAETVYGLNKNELSNNNKKVKKALSEILVNSFSEKTKPIIEKIKDKKEKKKEKAKATRKLPPIPIPTSQQEQIYNTFKVNPENPTVYKTGSAKKQESEPIPIPQIPFTFKFEGPSNVNRENPAYAAPNNFTSEIGTFPEQKYIPMKLQNTIYEEPDHITKIQKQKQKKSPYGQIQSLPTKKSHIISVKVNPNNIYESIK